MKCRAVLFVGLDETREAENFDRDGLTLPGLQELLIMEVLKIQPNTVVVMVHGGPVASPAIRDAVPAVLDAFYPGQHGGIAMVDALFGDYNPGGKMPYTSCAESNPPFSFVVYADLPSVVLGGE